MFRSYFRQMAKVLPQPLKWTRLLTQDTQFDVIWSKNQVNKLEKISLEAVNDATVYVL